MYLLINHDKAYRLMELKTQSHHNIQTKIGNRLIIIINKGFVIGISYSTQAAT
jgi:hypothetical protein